MILTKSLQNKLLERIQNGNSHRVLKIMLASKSSVTFDDWEFIMANIALEEDYIKLHVKYYYKVAKYLQSKLYIIQYENPGKYYFIPLNSGIIIGTISKIKNNIIAKHQRDATRQKQS